MRCSRGRASRPHEVAQLRPRDDRGHQRPARGARRAHGAGRHRGLRRRARDRPPDPARAVPPLPARARARWSRASCASRCESAWAPDGVLRALDDEALARWSSELARTGAEAVAVSLLHSYARPRARAARGRGPCAERLPDVHVSASHEVAERLSRVRAHLDHRDRRLPVAAAGAATSSGSRTAPPRAGLPEPEIMRSSGGLMPADAAGRHAAWTVLSGPAAGAVGRRPRGRRCGEPRTCCPSTWAAPPATWRVIDGGRVRQSTRAARSPGGRSSCRWWTCTPSAPAAAASPGPTPAARCGSARSRPARSPGPACYGRGGERADRHRCQPAARLPDAGRGAGRRRAARSRTPPSARWRARRALGMGVEETARGHRASRRPGDAARAARRDRRARRSTRAATRWSPSAAPGRCMPLASPRSSRSGGSSARARPACCRRSGWSTAERRRDAARTVLL